MPKEIFTMNFEDSNEPSVEYKPLTPVIEDTITDGAGDSIKNTTPNKDNHIKIRNDG